jgi:hypothetical protein
MIYGQDWQVQLQKSRQMSFFAPGKKLEHFHAKTESHIEL